MCIQILDYECIKCLNISEKQIRTKNCLTIFTAVFCFSQYIRNKAFFHLKINNDASDLGLVFLLLFVWGFLSTPHTTQTNFKMLLIKKALYLDMNL